VKLEPETRVHRPIETMKETLNLIEITEEEA